MHVALVCPIAGPDVQQYLHPGSEPAPQGYDGAPLTGVLIGELLRQGHQVTGITTDSSLPLDGGPVCLTGERFKLIVCPARRRAWRFNGWRLGRAVDLFAFERRVLREALDGEAPDIAHAHWSYEFALGALDWGGPHLITCHDSPAVVLRMTRSFYRALRYLMAREVFRSGRAFTTVSNYMADELAPAIGHRPSVVANPVAAHVFDAGAARPAPASRKVAMISNGWDRRKNPEAALRAFALWRATESLAELHLFGFDYGPGETAQQWAQQQGLSAGVQFHGKLPHRDMVAALIRLDALLHPALEESFGVVIAEAMALGLPIVAGRYSAAVPWVMGADPEGRSDVGVLVDVTSAQAMAAGLTTLFDGSYEARSAAGVRRASELYSPPAIVGEYLARYEQVRAVAP